MKKKITVTNYKAFSDKTEIEEVLTTKKKQNSFVGKKLFKQIEKNNIPFSIIEDKEVILFVIDEVGFCGYKNRNLRHYAYSKIGEPAVYKTSKFLKYNLTCSTTISKYGVEFI